MAKATVIASARHPNCRVWSFAAEDYRRLARLAKTGDVKLEIDSRVHFEDADHNAYNVLADIPGQRSEGRLRDGRRAPGQLGGRRWRRRQRRGQRRGDGGCANSRQLGVRPKRTIRFALWSGEEEGLLGSAAYVEKHLARRPAVTDPAMADLPVYFYLGYLPGGDPARILRHVGYFNIDNGSGRIRGIYTEGNFAVVPIFREWLTPFASLGRDLGGCRAHGRDRPCVHEPARPARVSIRPGSRWTTRPGSTTPTSIPSTIYGRRICGRPAVVLASILVDTANSERTLPRKVVPTPAQRDRPLPLSGSGEEIAIPPARAWDYVSAPMPV